MAARKNKTVLSDTWRNRIKVGVIMERLERCANGKLDLTAAQLKAAQLLLSKVVPDLARTELAADRESPLTITINYPS